MRAMSLLLLAAATFASCQPTSNSTSKTESTSNRESHSSSTPKYWHLIGLVGKYPVVMDLAYRPTIEEGYSYFGYHGSYYYKNKAHPIDLYGSVDSTGLLILTEVHYLDTPSPSFSGVFDPEKGIFSGTWTDGAGNRKLAFSLSVDYADGAVAFDVQKREAREKLFPEDSNSPAAGYSMIWLTPSNADANLKAFLDKEILLGLSGDAKVAKQYTADKAFATNSKDFFRAYKSDLDGIKPEEIEDAVSFNQEQNIAVEVLYNEEGLLTLGYWTYWYTGGAHGNYATTLRTYDLKSAKVVGTADVFRDGYAEKLIPHLENAVRTQFGLNTEAPLDLVLFSNEIQATENFGLTGKGIIFNYPPYEIGAYALGEIRLFVPYSDIKPLLQPDFSAKFTIK